MELLIHVGIPLLGDMAVEEASGMLMDDEPTDEQVEELMEKLMDYHDIRWGESERH